MNTVFYNLRSRWQCWTVLAMLWLGITGSTQAVILDWSLDWNAQTWTAGSMSQSFDIDTGHTGNEVTITVSGDTSFMSSGYPLDNNTLTGGQGASEESMRVDLNWTTTSQSITITVAFDTTWATIGVENVEFTLFDVDAGAPFKFKGKNYVTYQDEIRTIKANYNGGSDIAAASVTGSASNSVSGSGLTYKIDGTGGSSGSSSNGNATISFGTNVITQFAYTYGNGPTAFTNPAQQTIGLWDINFRKRIPEYHPALAASLMCGLMGVWRSVRRRLAGS